jgi:hypothetical protein
MKLYHGAFSPNWRRMRIFNAYEYPAHVSLAVNLESRRFHD